MKSLVLITSFITALTLSGCAAMSKGSTQSVKVSALNTLSASSTRCALVNEEGNWSAQAEIPVQIHRDGNIMDVDCKNATESGRAKIEPRFDGAYLMLDLLIDLCIISCIVDGGSNSFYSYPENITVLMKRN